MCRTPILLVPPEPRRLCAVGTDMDRWKEYGQAHAEVFGDHPPTTTMVEVRRLIHPDMLIEIEADAIAADAIT